jgi:hypothetical protein
LANKNAEEMVWLGWHKYFRRKQHPTSINPFLHHLPQPTDQYLTHLACAGAPVDMFTPPWTLHQ